MEIFFFAANNLHWRWKVRIGDVKATKLDPGIKFITATPELIKITFVTFQNLMLSRLCVTVIHNYGLSHKLASSLLTLVEEPWRTGGDSSCSFWSVLEAIYAANSDCCIFAMVASKLTSTMVPSSSSGMMNRTIAVLWWPLIAAPEKKHSLHFWNPASSYMHTRSVQICIHQ